MNSFQPSAISPQPEAGQHPPLAAAPVPAGKPPLVVAPVSIGVPATRRPCASGGERPAVALASTPAHSRAAVIAEAKTWLGTPFRHSARIKHVGADCETFICEVYAAAGVFHAQGIPFIPAQWYLNGREELYLNYLSRYATEFVILRPAGDPPTICHSEARGLPRPLRQIRVAEESMQLRDPLPGDIIVVKHRWVHSHGAIVVAWPQVIHCHPPGVRLSDIRTNPVFAGKQLKFFDPFKQSALSHQPSAEAAGSGVSG